MPPEEPIAKAAKGDTPRRYPLVSAAWPWALIGWATLFFAAYYVPKFYFYAIDTETVFLPLFYHDIVDLHHSPANWGWGGVSAIFPDLTVFFLLSFLCQNGQLALQLLLIWFFLSWIAASMALAMALRRPHKLSLFTFFVLFWVASICNYALPIEWGPYLQKPLFEPVWHGGTSLLCLVCLTLLVRQITGGQRVGLLALLVLTFLGGISDSLFFVVFALPALGSLTLLVLAFPANWLKYASLGLGIVFVSIVAYVSGPHIFPVPQATDAYVQVGWDRSSISLASIWWDIQQPEQHFLDFLIALDCLTVLGGIGGIGFFFFYRKRKQLSPLLLCLLAFCSASILGNWLGVIFTGDYHGITETRYLSVALITPLIILVFALHSIIFWRPWLEKLVAVVISLFTVAVAFIPLGTSLNYYDAENDIPDLRAIMKQNHIQYCLANYWNANIMAFLSNGDVPTRSLTNDGKIYEMVNSLEWFGKGHPLNGVPHFRLIYIPDHGYSDVFGKPDQIVYTSHGSEVWIYSDERSIRYNEHFDVLSNNFLDDGRTLRINVSNMPGNIGEIVDHAKIATEGKDPGGWLCFGPYIKLAPGHYHATFHYTYLTPPAPDKLVNYDLRIHTGKDEQSYHFNTLPCPNNQPQAFTDDVVVTQPNQTFEMRLQYNGSGTIRVDSLDVTYLGP